MSLLTYRYISVLTKHIWTFFSIVFSSIFHATWFEYTSYYRDFLVSWFLRSLSIGERWRDHIWYIVVYYQHLYMALFAYCLCILVHSLILKMAIRIRIVLFLWKWKHNFYSYSYKWQIQVIISMLLFAKIFLIISRQLLFILILE